MEGLVRDGATSQVLMEFKDRQADKVTLFSIKEFQEYGFVREAIDAWARELAELLATTVEHQVTGELAFTLNPF
jgi:hypothetical protein